MLNTFEIYILVCFNHFRDALKNFKTNNIQTPIKEAMAKFAVEMGLTEPDLSNPLTVKNYAIEKGFNGYRYKGIMYHSLHNEENESSEENEDQQTSGTADSEEI
jgi:hypothetical protein